MTVVQAVVNLVLLPLVFPPDKDSQPSRPTPCTGQSTRLLPSPGWHGWGSLLASQRSPRHDGRLGSTGCRLQASRPRSSQPAALQTHTSR